MTTNESSLERLRSLGAEFKYMGGFAGKDPESAINVGLYNWRGSSADLRLIEKIPGVDDLCVDASCSPLRDEDVEQLANLPNLRGLYLCETGVTGAALRHLRRAKDLATLRLCRTSVTDTDLDAIADLNRLSELDISETAVKGHLTAVPQSVERLLIKRTRLETLSLVPGAARTALHILMFAGSPVTDTMLDDVGKCPNLVVLGLEWTRVTDRGLAVVGRLQELGCLTLDHLDITDVGLEALVGLNKLWRLTLTYTKITDNGLEILSRIPNLRLAYLLETGVTAKGEQRLEAQLASRSIGL